MATIFYMVGTSSDLTNASAALNGFVAFNISATASFAPSGIASGATQTISFFTPPLWPGLSGISGTYSFLVPVSTANANISATCQLHRINDVGTVQASSTASASQNFGSVTTFTYTFTSLNLGTFAETDRMRIDLVATNGGAMNNQQYAITNTTGTGGGLYTPHVNRNLILG